jgi:DNA-binding MarR family transcriptional regulator
MIRKSNQKRAELLAAFGRALPAFQDATDTFDEAAAEVLGLNRTDLRALGIAMRGGGMSPSTLADAAGLSRSAMTTALDRLEQAGYIRRVPDPDDRRGLCIESTPDALRTAEAIWGPLAAEGETMLAGYTTDELAAIVRCLLEATALQDRHVERIRGLSRKNRPRQR